MDLSVAFPFSHTLDKRSVLFPEDLDWYRGLNQKIPDSAFQLKCACHQNSAPLSHLSLSLFLTLHYAKHSSEAIDK
jgi:hypothetical protein